MDLLERIYNSIDYIEKNLKDELSLKNVAEKAYMSPYHYHRVFQAISGVNVGVYIRLRKLTLSAESLVTSKKRIIEIAMDCGYETQESFSRAFKKQFLMTPAQFRKKRLKNHFNCRYPLSRDTLEHLSKGVKMKPDIVELESFLAVGLESVCTQKNGGVPALWQQFVPRINDVHHKLSNRSSYGVCQYMDIAEFTDETEFIEFVCVPVTSDQDLPQGMTSRTIEGGKFALFTHKGSLGNLKETYDYIFGSWLPKSGYEIDKRDDLEMYDHRFNPADPENSQLFIYMPIK